MISKGIAQLMKCQLIIKGNNIILNQLVLYFIKILGNQFGPLNLISYKKICACLKYIICCLNETLFEDTEYIFEDE